MKKSYLLSGMIALSAVASISCVDFLRDADVEDVIRDVNGDVVRDDNGNVVRRSPEGIKRQQREQRKAILDVQHGKVARQKELVRPAVYKMLDALITDTVEGAGRTTKFVITVDWPAVFAILDSMEGVIDVNEYRTLRGSSLFDLAGRQKNFSAATTLVQKYKAIPSQIMLKSYLS